jgi:hypothetical protein
MPARAVARSSSLPAWKIAGAAFGDFRDRADPDADNIPRETGEGAG